MIRQNDFVPFVKDVISNGAHFGIIERMYVGGTIEWVLTFYGDDNYVYGGIKLDKDSIFDVLDACEQNGLLHFLALNKTVNDTQAGKTLIQLQDQVSSRWN